MGKRIFNCDFVAIANEAQARSVVFYLNLTNREDLKLLIIKPMPKPFVIPYALPSKFFLALSKYVKPTCNQTHD